MIGLFMNPQLTISRQRFFPLIYRKCDLIMCRKNMDVIDEGRRIFNFKP